MDIRSGTARRRGLALAVLAGVLGGLSLTTPAVATEGAVLGAGQADVIKDSYIVVLARPGVDASSLTARHGGRVEHRYTAALNGYAAIMTERQAKRLAADPAVAYVAADRTVRADTEQLYPPSWGLNRVDQGYTVPPSSRYIYSTTASNVNAYILDTGINMTHTDFGGRAVSGIDTVDNDADATDCNGHGTHVAGTVGGSAYGVAKGVDLIGVRVLDCFGNGSYAGVIAGVDWVTANHVKPAVANMSLTGGGYAPLDTAVANSIAAGVTYTLSAGNNGADACDYSPARTPAAITVAATDGFDIRADFSNYGSCVDIFAPGVDITSAWVGGNTAGNTISGTSMAAPHVAGAAALYLSGTPTATPADVRGVLNILATPGTITNPGAGSPSKMLKTPGSPFAPFGSATNGTDSTLPDGGAAIDQQITFNTAPATASATSVVGVHLVHQDLSEVSVRLIAPDGSVYPLINQGASSGTGMASGYMVNLSSEQKSGTWKLRVQDHVTGDTGYLSTFSLHLDAPANFWQIN
ncbi:S8 family peptidase [Actinokineospora iranica]|uniref:Peptidase inhibitor I9 n=1 Tax=Actinokineospora iranica TaxID=1271860 RepID=A0A1G6V3K2_9PSEU|nr:S8 family peptidase [Actinokineospora iranica]SDD47515.1 Peptidase inhibitor I9 [Actinokineospora iranica]